MPLVFRYYESGDAHSSDLGTEVVRFGTLALEQSGEIGEASISTVDIDDPQGNLDFVGLRQVNVFETSAPSNNQLVWGGKIGDKRVHRGPSMRTGSARVWTLDLVDQNTSLGYTLIVDADGKRPAETAGDRLRWVLGTRHSHARDFGHVTYPTTAMDACDYRGQYQKDVINDCALASGYNFWLERNEAHGLNELFFMDPNSSDYASTLDISNVYSDVASSSNTYAPYEDAELSRSPSRITYGAYVAYENGNVYAVNEATGSAYAYVDQTAPLANVKTAAKALNIANRFLSDNDTEDDRITCAIKVPAVKVNDVRAGHLIGGRFEHLPSYSSNTAFRVIRRTVFQDEEGAGEGYYRIGLELSPSAGSLPYFCPLDTAILGTTSGTYPALGGTTTDSTGIVWYTSGNGPYFNDGHSYFDGPYPNQTCHGFGFPVYGGGADAAGLNVQSTVGFVFVGTGTAEVALGNYDGAYNYSWTITYRNAGGNTVQSSGSGVGPDTLTVATGALPGDAVSCYRILAVKFDTAFGGSGASKGTFAGLTWTRSA